MKMTRAKVSHMRCLVVLSVFACVLSGTGCDQYVATRLDVYEGKEPGYRVTEVSNVKSLDTSPLKDVQVRFIDRGLESSYTTDSSGICYGEFIVGSFGWQGQTKIRFKCTKEGYSTVKGSFTLGEFMGEHSKPRGEQDKTVLVRMKPLDGKTAGDSGASRKEKDSGS